MKQIHQVVTMMGTRNGKQNLICLNQNLGKGTSVNSINIPQASTTNLDWCKCGNCEIKESAADCICCAECKVSDTISTYNELVENNVHK